MSRLNPDNTYWTHRRSGKPGTNDDRSPWDHDYARIVHSSSFRRLQAKTQILGIGEGDFHRTRLTHTLEVNQIGTSITKKLRKDHQDPNDCEKSKWLPKLPMIQAICLAHDLGHPPFGHDGEVALNRCMLGEGGFEGNGQTLRIITKLDKHSENHGMDLTRRTVLGVMKYPAPYNCVNNNQVYPEHLPPHLERESVFKSSEFTPPKCYLDEEHEDIVQGWLAAELDDWSRLSGLIRRPNKHHKTEYRSLDTSIMELADDIAYGVHDLEDAIALNLMTRPSFENWMTDCHHEDSLEPLLDRHFGGNLDTLVKKLFGATHERKHAIGQMVGFFVGAIIINTERTFAHPLFKYQAILGCSARKALDTLKEIVRSFVIDRPEVQQLRFKGQKIVTELFHAFATDPKRLLDESDYQRSRDGGGHIPIKRVICDYIAGMTDDYAIRRYQQLFVPHSGSVFDRL